MTTNQVSSSLHPTASVETSGKPSLTVIILTFNEAIHIERALDSIAGIAREIFVIDSYSTDQTIQLATAKGATVLQHQFTNQAKQFQWALDHIPMHTEWVMRLDADEIIENDLVAEILTRLSTLTADVVGVNLKRKHIFMNRWIRHGGRYPLILLRIWRNGKGFIEDRWMDEHIIVSGGKTITFSGGFTDHNLNDLTSFTDKHNKYATREAIVVLNQRYHLFSHDSSLSATRTSFQASLKRQIKERIYNKIPFQISAAFYFLFRYLIQLGFLDGREGLIYHFLQGFWYRFLVGAKIFELEKLLAEVEGTQARKTKLAQLTGLQFDP